MQIKEEQLNWPNLENPSFLQEPVEQENPM
jgi:hypothetical protein